MKSEKEGKEFSRPNSRYLCVKNDERTGMEIKEIGKEGLIERISQLFGDGKDGGHAPFGGCDRASSLGGEGLTSTVLLMEGVDFDLVYFPLNCLGFKTVTSAVAGIYGSGGKACQLSLVLGISQRFQVEDVEFFMRGVSEACRLYGVDLSFFDLTSSLTGFAISATAFGVRAYDAGEKANPGELICITGDLGAAYMGLQLMVREKKAFDATIDFQPDFGGREYLLERQLKPVLPVATLDTLRAISLRPTYLSVLKSGLSDALVRLSRVSGVGCRIYEKTLPIDFQTIRMSEDFGLDPSLSALHGGEDYQFIFTILLTDKERMDALDGVTAIGFTTETSEGLSLVGRSGGTSPIRPDDYATKD